VLTYSITKGLWLESNPEQNHFYPAIEGACVKPKFGKESDLWDRLDEESVRWKEGFSHMYSAERSAVGYMLPFGKGTVELILRVWTVTWLKQEGRMDG
jgi:hypothetical protein